MKKSVETDWHNHVGSYKQSCIGSFASYCRERSLNYYQFLYHYHKHYPKLKPMQLITVRLKENIPPPVRDKPLGKVLLSRGHVLYIFDTKLLSELLARVL